MLNNENSYDLSERSKDNTVLSLERSESEKNFKTNSPFTTCVN